LVDVGGTPSPGSLRDPTSRASGRGKASGAAEITRRYPMQQSAPDGRAANDAEYRVPAGAEGSAHGGGLRRAARTTERDRLGGRSGKAPVPPDAGDAGSVVDCLSATASGFADRGGGLAGAGAGGEAGTAAPLADSESGNLDKDPMDRRSRDRCRGAICRRAAARPGDGGTCVALGTDLLCHDGRARPGPAGGPVARFDDGRRLAAATGANAKLSAPTPCNVRTARVRSWRDRRAGGMARSDDLRRPAPVAAANAKLSAPTPCNVRVVRVRGWRDWRAGAVARSPS